MDKLRLDLENLEVERLDGRAVGMTGGLESFGMARGSTELAASCQECNCDCNCDLSCAEESGCGDCGGFGDCYSDCY